MFNLHLAHLERENLFISFSSKRIIESPGSLIDRNWRVNGAKARTETAGV